MTQFQLGSISTGTLRTEDLLEAFASTLQQFNRTHPLLGEYLDIHANDAWDSDKAADLLNEGFFNALQEICPPFVYFGTLEGDGADFGFWPDWDSMGETIENKHDGFDWEPGEYELNSVIVKVHSTVAIDTMDMERNILWSVV
jgi:hypothetical protein